MYRSIKTKYILVGLAICLVSLTIASAFSYRVSRGITADLSDSRIHEAVLRNSAEIEHWFESRESMVASLAQDIEASGDFSPPYLLRLIKNKMEIYQGQVLDFYIGFAGNQPPLLSGVDWEAPSDYDATARSWYEMASKVDQVIFTEPYLDAMTRELVITVAKAIRKDGAVVGVLAADIYLTEVIKAVNAAKINDNSYGLLLDSQGRVIAHPNQNFLPDDEGLKPLDRVDWPDYRNLVNTLLVSGVTDRIELRGDSGDAESFNFSTIAINGWHFGISVSKAEYTKPLRSLLLGFGGAFIASVFFSLLIMVRLMDTMIKPIKNLNATVKALSQNLSVRTQVASNDEIGELGQSFNQMADIIEGYSRSLEKKVEERTAELQQKNATIMESIEYARRIQNAIIPDISKKLGIPEEDCFAVWEPRDIVGGDMFWGKGDDDHALLAVADCTGHGVPGAFMSMMLNSILDAASREYAHDNPAEMLSVIDARMKDALSQNEQETSISDGADMALLFIDKRNRRLVYSGAKQDLYVASNGDVQVVKASRRSIGYSLSRNTHYENVEFAYAVDSVCYFATDGLLDQNDEGNRGGMGRRGFTSLITSICHLPMSEQSDIIRSAIDKCLSQVPQLDDITVVGIRLSDKATAGPRLGN